MKNKTTFILLVAAIVLLKPLFSSGQDTRIPADKKMFVQNEKMEDKYLPNANNNKRTSPAYKYNNTKPYSEKKSTPVGAPKLSGSSVFTTQVNVDPSGQNILGDAANEPSIAVNPLNGNKLVIGWRQFDNVSSNFRQAGWGYSSNAGSTWTFPGVINPGLFRSDPVLNYDTAGNFYYNSSPDDYTCQVFKSVNAGVSWDAGTSAGGGDKQWMTIDRTSGVGGGNIYSFWSSYMSTCSPGFFTRSTDDDMSYESCTEVGTAGDPSMGTMAVGNAGELYLAGRAQLSDSIVVIKSLNAQMPGSLISWSSPVLVYMDGYINFYPSVNPEGLLGQANIDVDRSNGPGRGNVCLLASVTRISNSDPGDVMFVKSADAGLTWSSPVQVNDDVSSINTQWLAAMSVTQNGRIDAVWLDNRDAVTGSDSSALYYSYSTDQGNAWSPNERLSDFFDPHLGYPNQNKMGDYFHLVSDNAGAHLAWAGTFNGEEDVYYSHITPPVSAGVNDLSQNIAFSIFPNPTSGNFVVATEVGASRVEIYNSLGEKIYSMTALKNTNEIDISSQPAGIYFLKIIDRNGLSRVKKLIKN